MSASLLSAAQTVAGRVVDGDGRPLAYSNVVALSLPDSAFVSGVMTGDDGSFKFDAGGRGRLLRFSSVGYKTVYADAASDVGTIVLTPETQMLGEVGKAHGAKLEIVSYYVYQAGVNG